MQSLSVHYQENQLPNPDELKIFFEDTFKDLTDGGNFTQEQDQSLDDWFSVEEMLGYLSHGRLIEARLDDGTLVGAIFIGKQNPISWLDGKKMELFILSVHKLHRRKSIARKLVLLAESYAKHVGSKKIIVNTHVLMEDVHTFYEKLGYEQMGILDNYYENGNARFFQKVITA